MIELSQFNDLFQLVCRNLEYALMTKQPNFAENPTRKLSLTQ